MNNISYDFFEKLGTSKIYEKISRPVIIADQIRTPENMGAVLRLAGNIGAQKTWFVSDGKVSFKKFRINRTSSGASDKVDWEIIQKEELSSMIPYDYTIVALETDLQAKNIFHFDFPEKVAFLVGNETLGLSDDTIQLAHEKVYIPVPGITSSLNVSHALSIGLFEWLRQMSIK